MSMLETSAEIEVSALPSCLNFILALCLGYENAHASYRLRGWYRPADQAARSRPGSWRHLAHRKTDGLL